jgi:hydrogenase maturation protease
MTRVRVIALGSPFRGDDEVALTMARTLEGPNVEVLLAGRPGPGLIDLLDTKLPVVLLDVVCSDAPVGTILELSLHELRDRALATEQVSSHGFGPSEALRLAAALGRGLPRGRFIGIEGRAFELGAAPSAAVCARLDEYAKRAQAAITELATSEAPCTNLE